MLGVTWIPCFSPPWQEARAPQALLRQRQADEAAAAAAASFAAVATAPDKATHNHDAAPGGSRLCPSPLALSISESALQSGPYHTAAGPARGCPSL